jgi:hypothetical protein
MKLLIILCFGFLIILESYFLFTDHMNTIFRFVAHVIGSGANRVWQPPKDSKTEEFDGGKHRFLKRSIGNQSFAFMIGAGAITILVWRSYLSYSHLVTDALVTHLQELKKFVLSNTAWSIAAVAMLNFWSIVVANRARGSIDNEKKTCEYCGEDGSKIVCGKCDSVLYYQLSAYQVLGVFFAHHRWQITATLFGVFLAIPFGGAYQLIETKNNELRIYEKDAQEVTIATNRWRGDVMKMSMLPIDSIGQPLISDFLDSYFVFSWLSPRLFKFYGANTCGSSLKITESCINSIKENLRNKLSAHPPRFDLASANDVNTRNKQRISELRTQLDGGHLSCFLLENKLFLIEPEQKGLDTMNGTIIEYLDDITQRVVGQFKNLEITGVATDSVKQSIERNLDRLFIVGKAAGCLLDDLAFNPFIESKDSLQSSFGCDTILSDFLTKEIPHSLFD